MGELIADVTFHDLRHDASP